MSSVANYREIAAAMSGVDPFDSIGSNQELPSSVSPAPFDACSVWLELATRHLSDARVAQGARVSAWKRADERAKSGALEWEFEASLQAIGASGIAVDAFGAAVQSKVQLPQSLCDEWRVNSIPRFVQISEVIGKAFSLNAKNVGGVCQCLNEILRFRDLTLDPSQKSDTRVFHPELRADVEWRFAYFRYENALLIVQATLRLIWELVACGKSNDVDVQKYIDALRSRVEPLRNSSALADAAVSDA